jgi:hypothetical protein
VIRRQQAWSIAALIALSLFAGNPADGQSALPAAWLTRLATAANSRDIAALRDATAAGVTNDYEWAAAPAGMLTRKRDWQTRILTIPGAPAGDTAAFVTFSKYQQAESTGDHLYRVISGADGPRLGAEIAENDLLGTRVRHHRFNIRFDVPGHRVAVTDHVAIERTTSDFPAIVLRINTIYSVSSVRRNGTPVAFDQAGGFLAIQAPASGDPKRLELDLAYVGTADQSNEDFVRPDHAALTSYWYVHTGRMPASSDAVVSVPRGWSAIAQGEPVGKAVTATTATYSWSNRLPVCYITVAAGKYTVTTRKVGSVNVSAYLLKPSAARADVAIRTAGGAVNWFSRNFSRFPYTRYAVVETTVFPAALECYSFTLAGSSLIPMAVVHEVAHTWWGGIVPNTYTRSLWNESFAEYSDGLYGRMTGKEGMHEFNTQIMGQSGFVTKHTLRNATDAMDMEQSLLGYGKGSLVLENLERMLGTQRMLACMRNFIGVHVKERPGGDADWPDIEEAFAQAAGPEWRGYFGPWLNGTNLPTLRLTGVTSHPEGAGFVVEGRVTQADPAYWLQVPVAVETVGGVSSSLKLTVKSSSEPFRFETTARPVRVALDPKNESLRAHPKKVSAADLLSFQTLSGPLLVVVGTGGPAEESAVAREVAEQQAKQVFPFAAITVRNDTEASVKDLANANLLLIGSVASLRVPESLRGSLALDRADGKLRWRGKEWTGPNLWGLEIAKNPGDSRFPLGHVVAVTPGALRGFRLQGDLDARKGFFIVQDNGKPVATEPVEPSADDVVNLNREPARSPNP